MPGVIARMQQRIDREATPEDAGTLWTAADVLMGLRYPRDLVAQLLQGVHGMKDSVTYQAILEEGKLEGIIKGKIEGKLEAQQEVLLRLGSRRFGPPSASVRTELQAITELDRLDRLIERLLDVFSWEELLATP